MTLCHLTGVEPVFEARLLHAGDDQLVHDVFRHGGQQRQGHAHTQHHKQTGEMFDPHLESLERNRDTRGSRGGGRGGEPGRERERTGENGRSPETDQTETDVFYVSLVKKTVFLNRV